MKFEKALQVFNTILQNGPLGTRLKYDYGYETTFNLTEQEEGKKVLADIYESDIAIAQHYRLPIILNAATFRASKNHLHAVGFNEKNCVNRINTSCIHFIKTIQARNSYPNSPIFIGAPLGSMHDAYQVDLIPTIEEAQSYHEEQIHVFKEMNIDFVNTVTLPSLAEAIGISLAAERININYTIGFILNRGCTLLDGTSLDEAIQMIEARITHKPLGYLITCTHTSVIEELMQSPDTYTRLIGIQPNGSSLLPKDLSVVDKLLADSPEKFANEVMKLKTILGLKIVGGCCGTTSAHLQCIAQACAS